MSGYSLITFYLAGNQKLEVSKYWLTRVSSGRKSKNFEFVTVLTNLNQWNRKRGVKEGNKLSYLQR